MVSCYVFVKANALVSVIEQYDTISVPLYQNGVFQSVTRVQWLYDALCTKLLS